MNRFKFYALKLSGIIIVIFLLQVVLTRFGFTELFLLRSDSPLEFWRYVTAIFLHGGIGHLAYNVFALVLFGSILELIIGGRKFLTVFFVTGILANLIAGSFYSSSLGASGALFGVIGTLIAVRPWQVVWAFGLPMPVILAGIIWGAGDLFGAYAFFTGNPIDNTGNIAHLSGMAFGLIIGMFYRDNIQTKKRKQSRKRNPKERIVIDERTMRDWEDGYLR